MTSANPAITEAHQTLSLNGSWSLMPLPLETEREAGYKMFTKAGGEPLAAQVPGELHLDLMRAGRMEDPSVSDNARMRCRWPEEHSWWYRTEFILPTGFRKHMRQRLVFEGIDLYGQIFVNGKLAGSSENAFAPAALDVKGLLQEGSNGVVVRVTSGMELVPPPADRPATDDELSVYAIRSFVFERRRHLRKPAYAAYGWDWCDPLPNIGIWKGVRLEGRSGVVIDQLRLDTAIRGEEVSLEGEVTLENLHPWSEIACVLELEFVPPAGKPLVQRLELTLPVGRSRIPCRLLIPEPKLWWPNGLGEQPLYELTARLLCGEEETDRQVQTLGLRTIELDRSPMPNGSRFCFKVNGEEVYCKGGNWAPADLIPARIEDTRYERLVAEAKNAHFTMLRVNGVGLYESDAFYAACDRAGILVWQDFAFSCAQYPDQDPDFLTLVRAEAEAAVRRLRHHPALALWCGNNECNWGMANWAWECDPAKPEECGGVRIYNEVLPDICHFYDPARAYWPGSPFGGSNPNSETAGDTHWWGTSENTIRHPDERMSQKAADCCRARFVSEYGVSGPPHLDSLREYLKPDEISLGSTGWQIHTNLYDPSAEVTAAGIRNHYGDPAGLSLREFVLYGQMFQGLLQGRVVEAMRFRKGDPERECQGVLVWSYNDCWGEVGWSIIDHYLRRKASYYWFRRGAAPVKVLVRFRDGHLVTRVVNDTREAHEGLVRCGWMRFDGRAEELREHSLVLPANGMVEVNRAPLPAPGEREPREWLYAATLTGEGIPEDQAIWLFAPHRELALAEPVISAKVHDGALEVASSVYCHGVHLEDGGREVLVDNYFDLLPGIPRRIPITAPTASGTYPLTAIMPIGRTVA